MLEFAFPYPFKHLPGLGGKISERHNGSVSNLRLFGEFVNSVQRIDDHEVSFCQDPVRYVIP